MKVEINGKIINAECDFHQQIADLLEFGQYYGHNLNALWDRLTVDVKRPVTVVWRDSDISRDRLGQETFNLIINLLIEVQNNDLKAGYSERFEFELH
ncbi:barstar family protein [Chamaesiphon sp.]|uniref:barstar family protein n=1 Tax=Chamaesiphon sp. TaxID=2814140 RepID=UPI00359416B8